MAQANHDLHEFMKQASAEMASEYRRIFARTKEDPGTAGDEGEANWAGLLRQWLPKHYHVETKGRLIGVDGRMSKQMDVIVLKPAYPPKLLEKKVWLADGVAAVFECKNTLTAAHVRDAVERCADLKSLFRPRQGSPRLELRTPIVYGLLAHSHSWQGADSKPVENIQSALDIAETAVDHPRKLLDLICVSDLACWSGFALSYLDLSRSQDPQAGAWAPCTMFNCASLRYEKQKRLFEPIGAMLATLQSKMAWDDPRLWPLADYFRNAGLWGSGSGTMRHWPKGIYSAQVIAELPYRFRNGVPADDWNLHIA